MRKYVMLVGALVLAGCAFGSGSYSGSSNSVQRAVQPVHRAAETLGQLVVSVPAQAAARGYVNVHVQLACLVSTKATGEGTDAREGAAFAREAGPSMLAVVSDSLASLQRLEPADLPAVREKLRAAATQQLQVVLDSTPRAQLYEYVVSFGSFYLGE